MKQITGEEFRNAIALDPSWCLSIKEPIEITTFVDMTGSKITHLSPLLHFLAKESWAADFSNCKDLKEACGTFHSFTSFSYSGVSETKNLNIVGTDASGWSAVFIGCENLKEIEGTYEGAISLQATSIKSIKAKVKTATTAEECGGTPEGVKFLIGSRCINLKPEEKYLEPIYLAEDDFIKKCEKVKQERIRKELSRLPNI